MQSKDLNILHMVSQRGIKTAEPHYEFLPPGLINELVNTVDTLVVKIADQLNIRDVVRTKIPESVKWIYSCELIRHVGVD